MTVPFSIADVLGGPAQQPVPFSIADALQEDDPVVPPFSINDVLRATPQPLSPFFQQPPEPVGPAFIGQPLHGGTRQARRAEEQAAGRSRFLELATPTEARRETARRDIGGGSIDLPGGNIPVVGPTTEAIVLAVRNLAGAVKRAARDGPLQLLAKLEENELGDIPFIGDRIREAGRQLREGIARSKSTEELVASSVPLGSRIVSDLEKFVAEFESLRATPVGKEVLGRFAPTAKTATGRIAQRGVVEGAQFGGAEATLGAIEGEDVEEISRRALAGQAVGTLVGAAGRGIREGVAARRAIRPVVSATPGDPNIRTLPKRPIRQRIADVVDPERATRLERLTVERRAAERLAETDVLTGFGNRRAFEKAIKTADADPALEVISFDANNFGKVNKLDPEISKLGFTSAHDAGDQQLRDMAGAIRQAMANSGVPQRIFRQSGDEFVAIVPKGTGKTIAADVDQLFGSRRFKASGPVAQDFEVSLTGSAGDTFSEADRGLQALKGARKRGQPPTVDEVTAVQAVTRRPVRAVPPTAVEPPTPTTRAQLPPETPQAAVVTGRSPAQLRAVLRGSQGDEAFNDIRKAIEEVVELVKRDPEAAQAIAEKEGPKVMDQLATAVGLGEIEPTGVLRLIDELGLESQEAAVLFADMFRAAGSESGRTLNRFGQLKRALNTLDRESLKGLGIENIRSEQDVFSRLRGLVWTGRRSIIDVWRASITSQMSTAMRNLGVGLFRAPMAVFEDTLSNSVRALRGQLGWKAVGSSAYEASMATFAAMKPGGRTRFNKILGEFPKQLDELYGTPVFDIATGSGQRRIPGTNQYIKVLQFFNRTQETLARRVAFSGRLAARLSELKIDSARLADEGVASLTTAQQGQVRNAIEEAIESSLDITFARGSRHLGPKSKMLLKIYRHVPEAALIHPFPRFFANSMKFLGERTAIWRVMSPKLWKAAGKRGGQKESLLIAKAAEGVGLLGIGLAFRGSDMAGPKWYQVRIGPGEDGRERFIDLRPFSPLSTFAFIAELMKVAVNRGAGALDDDRVLSESGIEPSDFLEAFLGIRRLSGTALTLIEALGNSQNGAQFKDRLLRYVQTLLGGFTTPGRNLKAILSQTQPEEGVFLDNRSRPEIPILPGRDLGIPGVRATPRGQQIPRVFSEFVGNLPVIGPASLPPSASPSQAAPRGSEQPIGGVVNPLFRQVTGITISSRSTFENEARRLRIRLPTRLGGKVPIFDRLTDEALGKIVEASKINEQLAAPRYQRLTDDGKRQFLTRRLSTLRRQARSKAFRDNREEIIEEVMRDLRAVRRADRPRRIRNLPPELRAAVNLRLRR